MYVEFYFCVRYMWESRCVLYTILPILLDHPIQIQFNSFNFLIFFGGGGGKLIMGLKNDPMSLPDLINA